MSSAVQVSMDLLPADSSAQAATHAEPYLDADPSNSATLLGGWQENRFQSGGARASGYGASTDGGQTWSVGLIPNSTKAIGGQWERASDPWVAFGPNNRVYFANLLFNESNPDSAVGVSASSDGGRTWRDPVNVTFSTRDFSDKEAVVVDTFPASPHFGTVYVAWDSNVAKVNSIKQLILVARSTDGGATYQDPVLVRKKGIGNIGVIPRVAPDGSVYLVWLAETGDGSTIFLLSKSEDAGQTWSHPRAIADVTPRSEQGIRDGAGLPSFTIDPVTGKLYVAWQDGRFGPADQATLIQSTDGGKTWSDPLLVSDGPTDAAAFTVSVAASSNQVAVSYYSLQNDPDRRFLVDRYVRISTDGGSTFSPSIRATPASFDVRLAAQAGPGVSFLGDYAGLASAGGAFHLLWINSGILSTVTGKPQPEALTATAQ
ncbi:MAG TPA: sialidase family protein [Blastocatellia bacterium]|nr:sialidase family protein [Blastocatellia bacterium]